MSYTFGTGILSLFIFICRYHRFLEGLRIQIVLVENALEKQENVSMIPALDYQY